MKTRVVSDIQNNHIDQDLKEKERKEKLEKERALDALKSFNYKKDNLEHFKELLEKGISLDTPDENDELPLIKAISARNIDIIDYLISQKVNLYATDLAGQTGMMICARKGYLDIAIILLKAGYNLNSSIPSTDHSVLSLAVWAENLEMVRWLLNNKADMNCSDNQGWTPLMIAAYAGLTEIVKELLNRHADTGKKNIRGSTAFDLAVFRNHTDIIDLLKK